MNQGRDNLETWKELQKMTFNQFLDDVGMYNGISQNISKKAQYLAAVDRYERALRASVRGSCAVFPHRDPKDIFTNNFNKKIMKLTKSNHDIQVCVDPYATAEYTVDYCTKHEAGLSVLLKKIEEESDNLSDMEKMKKISVVLDTNREVSMQELIWRLLGLPMSKFSVAVKYINTNHPDHRDGLIVNSLKINKIFFKGDIDQDLESQQEGTKSEANKRVFHYSKHEYYECRPTGTDNVIKNGEHVDFGNLCLAYWLADFDHYTSRISPSCKQMGKMGMGFFKKRSESAVLRYYFNYEQEDQLARALCILFMPFRNEKKDIHDQDPVEVYNMNADIIEEHRQRFEHKSNIDHLIQKIIKEGEEGLQENSDDDLEEYVEER